jgi:hypothetical protein
LVATAQENLHFVCSFLHVSFTAVKQCSILQDPYTKDDLMKHRNEIFGYILKSVMELVHYARRDQLTFSSHGSQLASSWYIYRSDDPLRYWTKKHIREMKLLWSENAIQQTYQQTKFDEHSSLDYFMSDIDHISAADYVPSLQDVLRTSSHTYSTLKEETIDITIENTDISFIDRSRGWRLYRNSKLCSMIPY